MKIPVAFVTFCQRFHQDIFVIHKTMEGAIRSALPREEKARRDLAAFILKLRDQNLSDQQLSEIWRRCNSEFHFRGLRAFLDEVIKMLK
ncbi:MULTISPECIES: hypothetical protein [unclassified Bradyrhizobium]|uniref:hypothetical protein n=1 Tax=unclassified Bradyrhizobium TaxID=2631580 RepID=UPI002915E1DC|nr:MULTISPECIES: hypothetical protein [unclassified Bradyrhizobium]